MRKRRTIHENENKACLKPEHELKACLQRGDKTWRYAIQGGKTNVIKKSDAYNMISSSIGSHEAGNPGC